MSDTPLSISYLPEQLVHWSMELVQQSLDLLGLQLDWHDN